MVGVTGFEPATSASRKQRSTKLSYTPLGPSSLMEGTVGCKPFTCFSPKMTVFTFNAAYWRFTMLICKP